MRNKPKLSSVLLNGIITENPTFRLVLGICPTIAVTSGLINAIGMGAAATFVLVGSNFVISLLRNAIPDKVRIPCFIVVIASFVTIIEFLMKGYLPALYDSLGLFLSLITVNCIILGRAEAFASKNGVFASILDAVGMGLGFTMALFLMGSVREILGAGQWMGMDLHLPSTMTLFIMPAGGFFTLGVIIALVNKIANKKPPQEIGCANCPNAKNCPTFNKEHAEGGNN